MNGDVIGWITVPGTDINHPVLQAHASDPDYYLHHDIYRNYNPLGALYLDAECEKEGFQSPNAVILGHSLRIGGAITCFGNIQNYSDKTFASEHAKVLIQTPEKKMQRTEPIRAREKKIPARMTAKEIPEKMTVKEILEKKIPARMTVKEIPAKTIRAKMTAKRMKLLPV